MVVSAFSAGLETNVLIPRYKRKTPPSKRNQNCCPIKTSEIAVKPKAAIAPKIPSALAAPSPETKPENRPFARVRWMQRVPIGPTGAAIENPIAAPFIKTEWSISLDKIERSCDKGVNREKLGAFKPMAYAVCADVVRDHGGHDQRDQFERAQDQVHGMTSQSGTQEHQNRYDE